MNLGEVEIALLRALRRTLGEGIVWRRGPPQASPEAGLLPEVFVHAARLEPTGPQPARQVRPEGSREQGAARLDVDLSCRCGRYEQAQELAGQVGPLALQVLDSLTELRLDAIGCWRLLRPAARLLQVTSAPGEGGSAQVQLHFQLSGVLQTDLPPAAPVDPRAGALDLRIEADPTGVDLRAERVCLRLAPDEAPLALAGWRVQDAAGHAFVFPPEARLLPGQTLSVWTRRGQADATQFFWGRRKAVWNNTGDVALLLDAQGQEQARATWQPPLPVPKKRRC